MKTSLPLPNQGSALVPILAGLTVVALTAALFFYQSTQKKDQEMVSLREEVQKLKDSGPPRGKNDAVKAMQQDLERMKKDNQELSRLRNESRQYRDDKQQLEKLQGEVAQLRSSVKQQKQVEQENQLLRAQNLQAQAYQAQAMAGMQQNACIANLKQIDGATQQWALENRAPANSPVNIVNLFPYLKGRVVPVCPQGGTYSIFTVGRSPRCSVPGHAL